MKNSLHSKFIEELHKFLQTAATPDSILTTSIIKKWLKGLPEDHPVFVRFQEYQMQCGHDKITDWQTFDFNKIVSHMKHVPGFYRVTAYQRRVGNGAQVSTVTVKQNKIKI